MPTIRGGTVDAPKGPYYLSQRKASGAINVDYRNLPLRTHVELLAKVKETISTQRQGAKKELRLSSGINGQVHQPLAPSIPTILANLQLHPVDTLGRWLDQFSMVVQP
jgi:hypothetical protein